MAGPLFLPSPNDARRARSAELQAAAASVSGRVYRVAGVSGGRVTLMDALGGVHDEPYARLAGFALAPGDPVLVLEIVGRDGGSSLTVLGKLLGDAAPATAALVSQITIADIAAAGGTDGDALRRIGGVTAWRSNANPIIAVGVRGTSSGNVAGTSFAAMASLQANVTLLAGVVYDVIVIGYADVTAGSGFTFSMAASIDGAVSANPSTTGMTGQTALVFGDSAAVLGTGGAIVCAAANKVSGGTGTIREGWIMTAALPRN